MENEIIDNIFARATIEVWQERVNSGECTLQEMEEALIQARQK